ncbi:hypothetical protein F4680DRAFT_408926 [Xylaria scruposa]|nr:hypothetical protein F4680DRAFT_408926 [Xylaria scruposa]
MTSFLLSRTIFIICVFRNVSTGCCRICHSELELLSRRLTSEASSCTAVSQYLLRYLHAGLYDSTGQRNTVYV